MLIYTFLPASVANNIMMNLSEGPNIITKREGDVVTIIIIIVIISIVIIHVITFMQGIYNYIPETNHVSRVHRVAAVLYLEFVLLVMLFPMFNMFCTLHQHFPQFVCSAQYGCFLRLLNFVLPLYVAQVLSE